jgi:hypothetical protein
MLPGGGTTCRTGYGRRLFGSEFFLFHPHRIRNTQSRDRSMLNTFALAAARSGSRHLSVWREVKLVVQDDTEERRIYVESAVVLDETQFFEFVHEKINARPRGPNHFR